MSWSVQYQSREDLRADKRSYDGIAQLFETAKQVSEEACAAAVRAADALIESGMFGDPKEHDFYIYLSGHANPGHKPVPRWSNDFVTVTVTQK